MTDTPPTLLIVDDDRVTRRLLADQLQGEGRILMAKDGETALAVLRQGGVDLMLLDVSMAGMGGLDLFARVRADAGLAALPVLFVTGADTATLPPGLAPDILRKPVPPQVLLARVRAKLGRG